MTRGVGTDGGEILVRTLEAGEEPAVLALLQTSFGRWPAIDGMAPQEFFRWKFAECPFGPAHLRVAVIGGAVAGFAAYMPWQMHDGAGVLQTLRGADIAVDPAHRGRGVSMAIRRAAGFPGEHLFVWSSPNDQSHPGARKAGRRAVMLRRFASVGDARSLARVRRPAPATGVGAASAQEVLALRGDLEPLLSAPPAGGRIGTVRSLDYLRWRYGRFARYRAVHTGTGGAGGIAIVVPRPDGRVLHVCELIVADGDRASASRLIAQARRCSRAPVLTCRFPSAGQAVRAGFAPRLRQDVVDVHLLRSAVTPDPAERSSWGLSLGDLELL